MLFKFAGEIVSHLHRRSELIAGMGELKLEVVISGLFPRQVEVEREGFLKMLEAITLLRRDQQPGADFLVAAGEVAPSLRVTAGQSE